MKRTLILIFSFLMATGLMAQSVQVIPAWDDELPYINSIIDFMVADTNEQGEQLHDIYKLERGETYLIDQTISINNPIVLTSDPWDWEDSEKSPAIVKVLTVEGAAATGLIFAIGADFTVKNIYFAGLGTGSVWMIGNWANPTQPDIDITIDSVMFDYMGWSILANFSQPGISYYIYDTYVKNNQQLGDAYTPFLLIDTMPVDEIIVKNTTYFNSNGIIIQARNTVNYLEVDHCTFVNVLKHAVFNEALTHAKITNNIFYNTMGIGETLAENGDKDRDIDPMTGEKYEWGIVNVDTLIGNEVDTLVSDVAEADRNIVVKNNAWFYDQKLKDYWEARDLVAHSWMNERTAAMFANDTDWPGLVEENTVNEAPTFGNLVDGQGNHSTDLMINFANNFRDGTVGDYWGFEADSAEYPTAYRAVVEWPFLEDLSHTGLSITGTDGLPLGDTKWFGIATALEKVEGVHATNFKLNQNYPNPFNPVTDIEFSLDKTDQISLKVYNILGEEVATLYNGPKTAGVYKVTWNGTNNFGQQVSSGIYLYQLTSRNSGITQTRKMTLIR